MVKPSAWIAIPETKSSHNCISLQPFRGVLNKISTWSASVSSISQFPYEFTEYKQPWAPRIWLWFLSTFKAKIFYINPAHQFPKSFLSKISILHPFHFVGLLPLQKLPRCNHQALLIFDTFLFDLKFLSSQCRTTILWKYFARTNIPCWMVRVSFILMIYSVTNNCE
jgi:hypothetical protein